MSNPFTQLHYGRVHIRKKGSNLPPFPLGAMQGVTFTPTIESITIADPRTKSNSELDGVDRLAGGVVGGELVELPPETLAALLQATRVEVPTGAVASEEHLAMVGRTIMTERLPLAITTVKSEDGLTTYVAGVDYTKTPGGIRILAGGDLATDIAGETPDSNGDQMVLVDIAYTYPKINLIQPFTTGRQFWEVFVETTNEAGKLEGRRITMRRCRMSLTGELPLINRSEFAAIGISLTMSEDPDFFFDGESALFVVQETVPEE